MIFFLISSKSDFSFAFGPLVGAVDVLDYPNGYEEGLKLFEPKEEDVAGRFDLNPAYGEI